MKFFIELIKNLDFIQIENEEDNEILTNIKEGLNEVHLSKQRKIKLMDTNRFFYMSFNIQLTPNFQKEAIKIL